MQHGQHDFNRLRLTGWACLLGEALPALLRSRGTSYVGCVVPHDAVSVCWKGHACAARTVHEQWVR